MAKRSADELVWVGSFEVPLTCVWPGTDIDQILDRALDTPAKQALAFLKKSHPPEWFEVYTRGRTAIVEVAVQQGVFDQECSMYNGSCNRTAQDLERLQREEYDSRLRKLESVFELIFAKTKFNAASARAWDTAHAVRQHRYVSSTTATLDSLVDDPHLPDVDTLPPVPTPSFDTMYPHQRQALDFMTRRECSPFAEDAWVPFNTLDKHRAQYSPLFHAFSGNVPRTTTGGILADTMGTGKSVTALALIATTLGFGTTLIVCPPLLISQWAEEVDTWLPEASLRVIAASESSSVFANRPDIVLVSYTAMHKLDRYHLPAEFYRVIFDEAHVLSAPKSQNSSTQTLKSCIAVTAKRRWALTATPPRHIAEFQGIFAALHLAPLDNWVFFQRKVKCAIGSASYLAGVLMASMLRRTRTLDDILPVVNVEHVLVALDETHAHAYAELVQHARRRVNASVFRDSLLPRCSAPIRRFLSGATFDAEAMVADMPAVHARGPKFVVAQRIVVPDACPICLEHPDVPAKSTACAHVFCAGCIVDWSLARTPPTCPMCRAGITHLAVENIGHAQQQHLGVGGVPSSLNDLEPATHPKVLKATQLVVGWVDAAADNAVLVFSQFARTLDILEDSLRALGVESARIESSDGVSRFRSHRVRVLLMPLDTRTQGLNLTTANRVIIMDPVWDVDIEKQAIARAARMGQLRPVLVSHLACAQTLETAIVASRDTPGVTLMDVYRTVLA